MSIQSSKPTRKPQGRELVSYERIKKNSCLFSFGIVHFKMCLTQRDEVCAVRIYRGKCYEGYSQFQPVFTVERLYTPAGLKQLIDQLQDEMVSASILRALDERCTYGEDLTRFRKELSKFVGKMRRVVISNNPPPQQPKAIPVATVHGPTHIINAGTHITIE